MANENNKLLWAANFLILNLIAWKVLEKSICLVLSIGCLIYILIFFPSKLIKDLKDINTRHKKKNGNS